MVFLGPLTGGGGNVDFNNISYLVRMSHVSVAYFSP